MYPRIDLVGCILFDYLLRHFKGKTLTGWKQTLGVGSSFLYAGVKFAIFYEAGNFPLIKV